MKKPRLKIEKLAGNAEWVRNEYIGTNDNGECETYASEIGELDELYHEFHAVSENLKEDYEKMFMIWGIVKEKKKEYMDDFQFMKFINPFWLKGVKNPITLCLKIACEAQYINNTDYEGKDSKLLAAFMDLYHIADSVKLSIERIEPYIEFFYEGYSDDLKAIKKGKALIPVYD